MCRRATMEHRGMKDQHVAGIHRPRDDVETIARALDVRQSRQGAVERGGIVARLETRAVVEDSTMRSADEFKAIFLGYGLERDPHHRQLLAIDRKVRRVLMPRGA